MEIADVRRRIQETIDRAHAAVESLAGSVTDRVRDGVTEVRAAGAVVTALRQLVASE